MKTCNTCAWYCHSDGMCWGDYGVENGYPTVPEGCECSLWSFDGLTDEEREEYALMTMEMK